MARFKITPLYGEPFMVEADNRADARQKGHEQLRAPQGQANEATVIWRCDEADAAEELSLSDSR